jgi:hypothetical protein
MTPEAMSAYEASALQGDIYSMIRLAGEKNDLCVTMGNCPESRKEPGVWGKLALDTASVEAAKGNAEAMYLMFIVTGDDKWLEKSAENGYAFAQYFLGVSYREGWVSVRPRRPLRNHNQSGLSKPVYQHSCRREISKFLNRG